MNEQDQTESKGGVGVGSVVVGGAAGGYVGKVVLDTQINKLINAAKGVAPVAKEGETAIKDAVKPEFRTAVAEATAKLPGGKRQQTVIDTLMNAEKRKTIDSIAFSKNGDKGFSATFKDAAGERAQLTGLKSIPKEAQEVLKGDVNVGVLYGDHLKPLVEGEKSWVVKTAKTAETALNKELRTTEVLKKAGPIKNISMGGKGLVALAGVGTAVVATTVVSKVFGGSKTKAVEAERMNTQPQESVRA